MKNGKEILFKLIFPPVWLMIVLSTTSAAALVGIFMSGLDTAPIAIAAYVLSFYTLSVVCIALWRAFPRIRKAIKNTVQKNKYANRYLTDLAFKTNVSLYRSLAINMLYAAMKAVSAVFYQTWWFAIFAVYYTIMAVMRFLLVRSVRKNGVGANRLAELRRSRLCSVILISVNLILSGAVLMMVYFDKGFEYHGMLIYVMAAYTFYITAYAIVNIVKYRKYNSPLMSTAKLVSLASALISMLSLETAMLSQFGGDTAPEFRINMIISTGAGIAAVIAAASIFTFVRSTIEIKKIRRYDPCSQKEMFS